MMSKAFFMNSPLLSYMQQVGLIYPSIGDYIDYNWLKDVNHQGNSPTSSPTRYHQSHFQLRTNSPRLTLTDKRQEEYKAAWQRNAGDEWDRDKSNSEEICLSGSGNKSCHAFYPL